MVPCRSPSLLLKLYIHVSPYVPLPEHEACAQDLSELRWDLDNWAEDKTVVEAQVLAAVDKNKLLQYSIEELTSQWSVITKFSAD